VALGLLLIFVVGIVAVIAVAGFLRARISGNQAAAIGTFRAISSAETTYAAAANRGYYDSQHCLVRPAECMPGFRGESFLAEEFFIRSGYRFQLSGDLLGVSRPGTSPTSLANFAAVAVSVSSGTRVFALTTLE
jgi:hypothetical protein